MYLSARLNGTGDLERTSLRVVDHEGIASALVLRDVHCAFFTSY